MLPFYICHEKQNCPKCMEFPGIFSCTFLNWKKRLSGRLILSKGPDKPYHIPSSPQMKTPCDRVGVESFDFTAPQAKSTAAVCVTEKPDLEKSEQRILKMSITAFAGKKCSEVSSAVTFILHHQMPGFTHNLLLSSHLFLSSLNLVHRNFKIKCDSGLYLSMRFCLSLSCQLQSLFLTRHPGQDLRRKTNTPSFLIYF